MSNSNSCIVKDYVFITRCRISISQCAGIVHDDPKASSLIATCEVHFTQEQFFWRHEQVLTGCSHRVPVPAAHASSRDGSWGNYPLSRCVCNCKLKQSFPSGSAPAQASEQLTTFRRKRMKEMAVVCSQQRTTFVLLSAVCLNLPATLFTPQGDHVIRSPPLAHLSSCSTTPPKKDCSNGKKKTIKDGRRPQHKMFVVYAPILSCIIIICSESPEINFLFHPGWFQQADKRQPLFSVCPNVLFHITLYPAHCILLHAHSIFPPPPLSPSLSKAKSIVSARSLLSPPQSHLFNLSSLSRVGFLAAEAHRREGAS